MFTHRMWSILTSVVVLAVILMACQPQMVEVEQTPVIAQEVEADLEGVSELDFVSSLRKGGSDTIQVRTYRYDAKTESYAFVRETNLYGKLISRFGVLPIFSGLYTDKESNLIAMFPNEKETGDPALFSVLWGRAGDIVLTIDDFSRTPVNELELVAIKQGDGIVSVATTIQEDQIMRCIDIAMRDGSLEELMNCLGYGLSQAGTDENKDDNNFIDLLAEPDCSGPASALGGVLRPPDPGPRPRGRDTLREALRIEKRGRRILDQVNRGVVHSSLRDMARELGKRAIEEAQALERLGNAQVDREAVESDRNSTQAERDAAAAREQEARRTYNEARDARDEALRKLEEAQGLRYPVDPIDPSTSARDPRCQIGNEQEGIFINSNLCRGMDYLTCLRLQQDTVFGVSEGRCWSEVGPDDALRLRCEESDHDPLAPDLGDWERCHNNPSAPPDCFLDPPRSSQGQPIDAYIIVSPLGQFLAALCARGGCPDPGP